MKKNAALQIIALALAFILVAGVIVGVIFWQNGNISFTPFGQEQTKTPDEEADVSGSSLIETTISNNEHISLARSAAVTAADTNTVSVELTATVQPDNAPDKSVDWTVDWTVPVSEDAVLSDYVSVTPASDGSNVATVTFYKGFEGGSITVTATTRVGGFSATCLFLYDGAPESLGFEMNDVEYGNTDQIEVTAGQTYSINLTLDNTLGQVGSKYGTFEIVEVTMQGRFNAVKKLIVNGSVRKTENIVINLEEPTFYLYDVATEGNGALHTIEYTEFADISIEGNVLKIAAKKNEASFNFPGVYPRTGTQVLYDSPYVDPRSGGIADNCRLCVYVRDTVSGEDSLLYVDIISTVTGISMSETVVYI